MIARSFGLAAMDSLHVAAVVLCEAEELVTTERAGKPIHRVQSISITPIHENP